MNAILISRVAAVELEDAWDAADINDDASAFVADNQDEPGTVEGCRAAYLALGRALAGPMRLLLIELDDAASRELFNEADNRLDIARSWVKDTHPVAEPAQHRQAKAIVSALKRLLKQRNRLGI